MLCWLWQMDASLHLGAYFGWEVGGGGFWGQHSPFLVYFMKVLSSTVPPLSNTAAGGPFEVKEVKFTFVY
jgi:hypothetical protein